jgi:hypothetical protein
MVVFESCPDNFARPLTAVERDVPYPFPCTGKDMSDCADHKGWVYVLRLEDDCWYVGYSADVETRIASHFLGRGAQWTRLHRPIAVDSLQPGDEKLENVVTIALMAKRGYKCVRGGRYLEVCMPCPPPIVKAYSLRPPPPPPAEETVETICGHGVVFTKIGDSGPHAWRSRIFGEMACKQCPAKGFKVIYGATEDDARAAVIRWLGGGEEESHAGEVRSVCSDGV